MKNSVLGANRFNILVNEDENYGANDTKKSGTHAFENSLPLSQIVVEENTPEVVLDEVHSGYAEEVKADFEEEGEHEV